MSAEENENDPPPPTRAQLQQEIDRESVTIAKQGDKIADQQKALDAVADLVKDTESVEVDTETGKKQRYRIHNPNPDVVLSLGQPDEIKGYVGLSGVAADNVFVSATNGHLFMQSNEQMVLQTLDELVIQGNMTVLVGSAAEVYIAGKKGVVILGGDGPAPASVPEHGEDPPDIHLNSFEKIGQGIERWTAAREAGLAALGGTLAAAGADSARVAAAVVPGALSGVAAAIKGVVNAVTGSPVVAIHGDNGVSVVAPNGGVSVYGTYGVGILGAGKVEMVSPLAAEMFGGGSAGVVSAGKAGLESGMLSEVLSLRDVEVGARMGKATVVGNSVQLGELAGKGRQMATWHLKAEATVDVEVNANNKAEIKLDGQLEKMTATAHKNVEIKSLHETVSVDGHKKIDMQSSGFQVLIDGEGKRLTMQKMGGSTIEITEKLIKIKQSDDTMVMVTDQGGVAIKSKGNVIRFQSAGISINGSIKVSP